MKYLRSLFNGGLEEASPVRRGHSHWRSLLLDRRTTAESSGSTGARGGILGLNAVVLPGDIAFGAGGVDGQFLIFSDWSATPTVAYTENTIVKHSSAIWVALTTPGAADEPGVAAVWEKITDQTGSGGGAGLSDDTPERTGEGDEDEGTGTDASRSDHTHQVTDEAAHILDSVAGIDGKVADLSIENASRTWTTLVLVSDGGFVSHAGANQLTTTQAAALTYSVTRTGDAVDGSRAYVVIRIPDTEDVRDFRIRQSFFRRELLHYELAYDWINWWVHLWLFQAYALCRVPDPHPRGD